MPSYGFSYRSSTRRGTCVGKLYLRVIHGGESRSITTSYVLYPNEWDFRGHHLLIPGRRTARTLELREIDRSMRCDLRRLDSVVCRLEREGRPYTVGDIMSGYRSSLAAYTLVGYTDRLSAEMDRRGYHRRAKAYRTACGRLCGFAGIDNLSYEHITPSLLLDFQHSLRSEGLSMNTISFYMRPLRSIYHKAISDGCIPRREDNLFALVKSGEEHRY